MPLTVTLRSMPRLVCALVVLACASCLGWLSPRVGSAQDTGVEVTLTTVPAREQIHPDRDAARVTLTALLHGTPLPGGQLTLHLTAPPRSTVLSTDFPHVEGTPLLAFTTRLPQDGTITFDYVFPIRGVYTVDLDLAPVPGGPAFRPTSLHKTFAIAEAPEEVRNAWLLVSGLFVLGLLVGRVFARTAAARDAAPSSVLAVPWVVLGSLLVATSPGTAAPEHTHTPQVPQGVHAVQGPEGWELQVLPQPAMATVGQLVNLTIALTQERQVWPHVLDVDLTAASLEDGREVFRTTLHTEGGELSPRLQFFDGAPHRLTVTARPGTGAGPTVAPLTVTQDLEVIALHPPMGVKLRLMALLLGVLVLGMAVGFFCPSPFKQSTPA
jgi:hypothetical protein